MKNNKSEFELDIQILLDFANAVSCKYKKQITPEEVVNDVYLKNVEKNVEYNLDDFRRKIYSYVLNKFDKKFVQLDLVNAKKELSSKEMDEEYKYCSKCKKLLKAVDFRRGFLGKSGRPYEASWCKACQNNFRVNGRINLEDWYVRDDILKRNKNIIITPELIIEHRNHILQKRNTVIDWDYARASCLRTGYSEDDLIRDPTLVKKRLSKMLSAKKQRDNITDSSIRLNLKRKLNCSYEYLDEHPELLIEYREYLKEKRKNNN